MSKVYTRILVIFMTIVLAVSSVTACTKPKIFSVSFVVNSEIACELQTNQNGNVELPEQPSKTGYTFDGWYLDDGTWQKEFTESTSVSEDISVYAKFTLIEYVATFKADGEVVDTRTFTIEDATINDVPQVPSKGGYIGTWEDYSIIADNITVNAVYTVDPNGLITDEVNGITLNDLVNNFLYEGNSSLNKYAPSMPNGQEVDYSKPVAVELPWENNSNKIFDEYTVYVSENTDLSDALVYTTSDTKVSVINLKTGTRYFWKVVAEDVVSIVKSFETEKTSPRLISVDGVTNFRDLGGYSLGEETSIPQGLIYRSAKLDSITDEGKESIAQLGIKTEIDLRHDSENSGKQTGDESFIGKNVNYYHCPIGYGAINYSVTISDAEKQALQQVFSILADESNYPVVFHCVDGADRTGFVSYVLKAILGVNEEDIEADYLITNFSKQDLTSVRTMSSLDKLTSSIKNESGSTLAEKVENYLKNTWDISASDIASIKEILTVETVVENYKDYAEPEKYAYTIKVYKDSVECTNEFVLPVMKANAYSFASIKSWANANVPDGFLLDEFNSKLTQRIVDDNCQFTVCYVTNTEEQFIANITSQFTSSFRKKVALVSNIAWSDYGKLKWSGVNDYVATADEKHVDISQYQGMTLKITVPYGNYGLVFYDVDKNPMNVVGGYICQSAPAGVTGGVICAEILIPNDAFYVRTNYYNSDGKYAQSVVDYPFKAVVVKKTSEDITSLFTWNIKTAIRAKTTFTDYGVLKYSMNDYVGSNYVDVSSYQGKTLKITMINSNGNGLVFYDESKVAQKNDGWSVWNYSSSLGDVHVMEITIPEGAHYVRTTYYRGGDGPYANSAATTPFSAFVCEPVTEAQ